MNGTTALHDTIALLRSVEVYCYQVAHYVLSNEREAAEASENALLALSRDPRFLDAGTEERLRLTKKTAISCAMQLACSRSTPPQTKEPIPVS